MEVIGSTLAQEAQKRQKGIDKAKEFPPETILFGRGLYLRLILARRFLSPLSTCGFVSANFFALRLNSSPEIFPSCHNASSLFIRILLVFAKVSHLRVLAGNTSRTSQLLGLARNFPGVYATVAHSSTMTSVVTSKAANAGQRKTGQWKARNVDVVPSRAHGDQE
jgi:hypothetical protein